MRSFTEKRNSNPKDGGSHIVGSRLGADSKFRIATSQKSYDIVSNTYGQTGGEYTMDTLLVEITDGSNDTPDEGSGPTVTDVVPVDK